MSEISTSSNQKTSQNTDQAQAEIHYQISNLMHNTRRLYQFLAGLSDQYDRARQEILKETPSPTTEMAFAKVQRQAARQQFLRPSNDDEHPSSGIGTRLAVKYKPPTYPKTPPPPPPRSGGSQFRDKDDKSHLLCTHCGKNQHTKEQCFELIGYPEWWGDGNKKPKGTKGKSNMVAGDGVKAKAAVVVGGRETAYTTHGGLENRGRLEVEKAGGAFGREKGAVMPSTGINETVDMVVGGRETADRDVFARNCRWKLKHANSAYQVINSSLFPYTIELVQDKYGSRSHEER